MSLVVATLVAALVASLHRPRRWPRLPRQRPFRGPTQRDFGALLAQRRAAGLLALLAGLSAAAVDGWSTGLALAVLVHAVGLEVRDAAAAREERRRVEGWRAALQAAAAALQAGTPLPVALRRAAAAAKPGGGAAAGAAAALATAAATAELGGDPLRPLSDRPGGPAAQLAAVLALADELGAPPAVLATRLAAGLADRARAGRAASTALAGVRSTTRLLAVLPLAGIGLAGACGASAPAYLLGTPLGHACLLTAALLEALGLAWTRRLLLAAAS